MNRLILTPIARKLQRSTKMLETLVPRTSRTAHPWHPEFNLQPSGMSIVIGMRFLAPVPMHSTEDYSAAFVSVRFDLSASSCVSRSCVLF